MTHWSALGDIRIGPSANINTVLSIWRERSSKPSTCTYDRIDGIELGICGSEDLASLEPGMIYDYECTMPQSKRLSVQPGDIIGFKLPSSFDVKFRLYFDSVILLGDRPRSYVFNSHLSTLSLIGHTPHITEPNIFLTVEPFIVTTQCASNQPAQPTSQYRIQTCIVTRAPGGPNDSDSFLLPRAPNPMKSLWYLHVATTVT